MKLITATLLFSLLLSLSFSQTIELDYYPPKKEEVSDKDYQKGKYFLENTYAAMKDSKNGIVYADYWNVAVAYAYMGVHKAKVYALLQKAKETDPQPFCELVSHILKQNEDDWEKDRFYRMFGGEYLLLLKDCNEIEVNTPSKNPKEGLNLNGLNEKLIDQLIVMMEKDQRYRGEPGLYDTYTQEQTQLDKENQSELESLIQQYGYPGKSLVGDRFMDYAAIIVQHAGSLEYQEKYFPIILNAMKKGEIHKGIVKMLVDRIHWRKTGKQIFGSQVGVDFDSEEVIQEVKKELRL